MLKVLSNFTLSTNVCWALICQALLEIREINQGTKQTKLSAFLEPAFQCSFILACLRLSARSFENEWKYPEQVKIFSSTKRYHEGNHAVYKFRGIESPMRGHDMRLEDEKGGEGRLTRGESILNGPWAMSRSWQERFVDFRKGNIMTIGQEAGNP